MPCTPYLWEVIEHLHDDSDDRGPEPQRGAVKAIVPPVVKGEPGFFAKEPAALLIAAPLAINFPPLLPQTDNLHGGEGRPQHEIVEIHSEGHCLYMFERVVNRGAILKLRPYTVLREAHSQRIDQLLLVEWHPGKTMASL